MASGAVETTRPAPSARSLPASRSRRAAIRMTSKTGNSRSSWEARKRLLAIPQGQTTTTRTRARVMASCSRTAPKCMARYPASASGMAGMFSRARASSQAKRVARHSRG